MPGFPYMGVTHLPVSSIASMFNSFGSGVVPSTWY